MQNLREPIPQIAIQLAVLISKLARMDCPREWPELLPTLFEGIKAQDDLVRQRTLLTLHHVVKQLASKRLAGDRRTFQVIISLGLQLRPFNTFIFILTFQELTSHTFLRIDITYFDFSGVNFTHVLLPFGVVARPN